MLYAKQIAPENADEISGYCVYCYSYDVRAELAQYCGGDPDDVVLYEFDGYTKTAKYREA